MLIETILNIFIGGFSLLMDLLPTVNITLPTGFMDWFLNVFGVSAYFLPVVDFIAMTAIWFFVINFHIIWKFVQRIWDALPFT